MKVSCALSGKGFLVVLVASWSCPHETEHQSFPLL